MHFYYSQLGFVSVKKKQEGKCYSKGIIQKIPQFINNLLCVNSLHSGFIIFNVNIIIHKQEVINPILDSIIPADCFKNNNHVIRLLLMT